MKMQHAQWIAQAKQHWQEHQPKRYQALKAAGTLGTALKAAAQDTSNDLEALRNQGITGESAWEFVRERHLFPPEEPETSPEAEPSLGYLAARDVNQSLGGLTMPGEPENAPPPATSPNPNRLSPSEIESLRHESKLAHEWVRAQLAKQK